MITRRIPGGILTTFLSVLGLLLRTRPAIAQSYGLGDQMTTLGAAGFRADLPSQTFSFSFGYLFGAGTYRAPLDLPDGAEVFRVCVYGNVFDPGTDVDVGIVGYKLPDDGSSPFQAFIAGSEVAYLDSALGPGTACTTPDFSWTFHDQVDFDGDGTPDATMYVLRLTIDGTAGFGAARVWWRRQVSAPPGTPTFADVPSSDFGFQYIEALASSGITGGCGGGNYCPDAGLTRRQMAIFLAKALGLHWSN